MTCTHGDCARVTLPHDVTCCASCDTTDGRRHQPDCDRRNPCVYVVTHGSYSEFGIDRIYSTRVAAEQYIDQRSRLDERYARDMPDVEEWPLDADPVKVASLVSWTWQSHSNMEHRGPVHVDEVPPGGVNVFVNDYADATMITVTGEVADEGRILKVLRDRRAEWLATREGI